MNPTSVCGPAPAMLLLKPAGPDCNLDCDYCFYLDRAGELPPGAHRMSDAVLERMIADYLACDLPVHSFCWQGGEPALMGLDFYRRVVELQQIHGGPGTVIANSLQTNAVLIDDAWSAFLADYRFLVGVSLDGPPQLHDAARHSHGGGPTHARVLQGVRALQKRDVALQALTVVHRANVDHPRAVWDHLRNLGFAHLQFLPCVAFGADGHPEPWTVAPKAWGEFLCAVFDLWRAEGPRATVRNFDAVLQRLVDDRPGDCTMDDRCRGYLVVEHDGGLYPCDFYVNAAQRLGDLESPGLTGAMASARLDAFAGAKTPTDPACADCRHFDLCRGGCPARRDPLSEVRREWLCEGIQLFLDHARANLGDLATTILAERRAHDMKPPGSPS